MYGRKDLVRAYLGAQDRGFGDYRPESSSFNAALKLHYATMLDGLERLFRLRLDADRAGSFRNRALFMLFRSTTDALLALRTPWSGFLEAGLVVKTVQEAGPDGERIMAASERIDALTAESRDAQLEILDALVAIMLDDRADLTFDRADLRAVGVDDTPPDPADYPLYEG